MVLIAPETLEKLKHAAPVVNSLEGLEQEMSSILNRKGLSDHNKWVTYEQVLQKYLRGRNPAPDALPQALLQALPDALSQAQPESEPIMHEAIVRSFGNNGQLTRKATGLLDMLSRCPYISWDEVGAVTIHGTFIRGSHIIDLINDVLRSRQGSSPAGWEAFARVLASLNVPREYVVNDSRWAYIQNIQNRSREGRETAIKRPRGRSSSSSSISSEEEDVGRVQGRPSVSHPPRSPDITDDESSLDYSIDFPIVEERQASKRKHLEPFWPHQNFDLRAEKSSHVRQSSPSPRAQAPSRRVTKRGLEIQPWDRDNFDVFASKRRRRRGHNAPLPAPRALKRRRSGDIDVPEVVQRTKKRKQHSVLASNLADRRQRKRKIETNVFANRPVPRKKIKWQSLRLR